MPNINELRAGLKEDLFDEQLSGLYCGMTAAKRRVQRLIDIFLDEYEADEEEVYLFSAPGRVEIGGNHTDHNNGTVLAAAIEHDTLGLARKTDGQLISIKSLGFSPNTVDIEVLSPQEGGSTSDRIIRGMCAGFARAGLPYGGFQAVTQSEVPPGSGLSSSAAFENLIGIILDHLYGTGGLDPVVLAGIGNFTENIFLQKPSGLMDQTVSAVGGLLKMDFADPESPIIERVPYCLPGHKLMITGPIGSHADLTPEYAAIPQEMRKVAWALGQDNMRGVSTASFITALPSLMQNISGRALLRAYHFLCENDRASAQAEAMRDGDAGEFLRLINESGQSSFMYLQNVVTAEDQGLGVALALSESILSGRGAKRVHGGGFAGTIQAFVPDDLADAYITGMEAVFGTNSCVEARIREQGAVRVI
jgi:galactokinase